MRKTQQQLHNKRSVELIAYAFVLSAVYFLRNDKNKIALPFETLLLTFWRQKVRVLQFVLFLVKFFNNIILLSFFFYYQMAIIFFPAESHEMDSAYIWHCFSITQRPLRETLLRKKDSSRALLSSGCLSAYYFHTQCYCEIQETKRTGHKTRRGHLETKS